MKSQSAAGAARTMNASDAIIGPAIAQGLGDRIAMTSTDRSVTFAEIHALMNRFGNALRANGVGKGDRVLFLMDDSPELVAAYLGTMRIGAVAVALNVRLAARDVLYVLNDSGCRVLFVDGQFLTLYQEIAEQLDNRPLAVTVGGQACPPFSSLEAFLAGQSDRLEAEPMDPSAVAYWLYSSGTTGRPKAVMHHHQSVLIAELLQRDYLGVRPGDRIFTTSKMFFGWALGQSLMGALQRGATVIVAPGWPDAAMVADVVERHRPTAVFSTPVMYRNLLREGAAEREGFRQVRHFVSAGEKLPETLLAQWQEAMGKPILDGLGASETVSLFLCTHPDDPTPGSCGRKTPWAELRLVDEMGQDITTPDVPGQIAIRMSSQFCGYWNLPEQTAKALKDGWYFPGDMFYFDAAGHWFHQGRSDDMLKISGQWVSPSEIEACAATVAEISEAAVVGVPNDDGLVRLALFAVPKDPGADPARLSEKLLQTLKANLSIYKCPRTVRFVDEMPRTSTGKIQKFRLREMLRG